jgi:bifunctional non-homologous end joining protein LigD
MTFDQSRTLGELLSRLVVAQLPEISTIVRPIRGREGKVYLDYLQNRHGQLLVTPFSVRPLPGAPVSMPLVWGEVDAGLEVSAFTIRTASGRMEELGHDPVREVLTVQPDLGAVLEKLAGRTP